MGCKVLILLMAWICLWACNQQKREFPNGWYQVDGKNHPTGNPIVTPADFEELRLDSSAYTKEHQVYMVIGRLKAAKVKTWAEATEKAVGSSLTFVFDGKMVAQPSINARIESGSFSIGLPPEKQEKQMIQQMFQKLSEEMRRKTDKS